MTEGQHEEQNMTEVVAQQRPTPTVEPWLVLIVEDEEPIATALSFIVEDAGYVPLIAMHGRQALDVLRERHPALIITDLMMPFMNGAQLIAEVRAWPGAPPIVLMTAAGRRYSAAAHADEVLPKPFNIADVEKLLHRYLSTPPTYSH
jgi:two-component system chemotaxis response regulator CheY